MPQASQVNPSVIDTLHAAGERPAVVYRYAGDRFLLLEYGEMVLDLTMNFRIFGLNEAIKRADIDGVIETVPALRSMLIQYDSLRLPTRELVETLKKLEDAIPSVDNLSIPSRRLELPFMFPLDPRYAIVTPKYNPTRPWTPEGAVGIGGPCVAIYPVASPGGYQLFGRTIPIFDLQQRNPAFKANPILLKPADRIQWVRVTDDELEAIRARVYDGTYRYKLVEYEVLNVKAYRRFLDSVKDEVAAFQRRQAEAVKHIPIP